MQNRARRHSITPFCILPGSSQVSSRTVAFMPDSLSTSPQASRGRRWVRAAGLFIMAGAVVFSPTACSAGHPSTSPSPATATPHVPDSPLPELQPGPAEPHVIDVITIDLRSPAAAITEARSSTTTTTQLDGSTTRLITRVPAVAETVTLRYTVLVPKSATAATLRDGSVMIRKGDVFLGGFVNVARGFTDANLGDIQSPWIDVSPKRSATGDSWHIGEGPAGQLSLSQQITPSSTTTGSATPGHPRKAAAVFGTALIAGTQWSHREGGKSLMVSATILGRIIGQGDADVVNAELIRDVPAADSSVMAKQLRCHAEFAPTKMTWNLEPWRPNVPYLKYLLAQCNPVADK